MIEKLFNAVVTGVAQGSMIALVALGYSMVYGILKLINFAHGDLFMWGAYLGWVGLSVAGEGILAQPVST